MPDMTKTLEERVSDMEAIYTDMPEILNLRFDSLKGQASEIAGRLGLMDTLIATLTRDIRDLRSGMTAQLRLLIEAQRNQGELLGKQGEVQGMQGEVQRIQGENLSKQSESLRKQGESLRKQGEEQGKQGEILGRLDPRIRSMEVDIAAMKADVPGMKGMLAEILAIVKK